MLRLAHQILSKGIRVPDGTEAWCRAAVRRLVNGLHDATIPVIVADNVAQYARSRIGERIDTLYTNVAPPFNEYFIEAFGMCINYKGQEVLTGSHVMSVPVGPDKDNVRWTVVYWCYVMRDNEVWLRDNVLKVDIGEDGEVINQRLSFVHDAHATAATESDRKAAHGHLQVPFLTANFMHCKNVTVEDATAEVGPPAKWLRRMKQPAIKYSTVRITPLAKQKVRAASGEPADDGPKKRLHIARGHFATYTAERPMFGKLVGTFWVPQHFRGSAEAGRSVQTYEVNAPVAASA